MKTLQYCLKCPVCDKPMRDADSTLVDIRYVAGAIRELWMYHTTCASQPKVFASGVHQLYGLRHVYDDYKSRGDLFEKRNAWQANGWNEILDAFYAFSAELNGTPERLVNHNSNLNKGVYLLQCGEFYKIGVGDNVAQRVKQIQTATPYQVLHLLTLPSKRPYLLEHAMHTRFASKRVRGEWFALTDSDVAYIRSL